VFLVNPPIAVIVLVLLPRLVPGDSVSRRRGLDTTGGRVDVTGAVLITSSLTLIVDGPLAASSAARDHGTAGPPIAAPSSSRSARQAGVRLISEAGAAN
jgi:hypothetical protein